MSVHSLKSLEAQIRPLQQKLLQHPVYEQLQSAEALQIFMQQHVFAVWDFMWLLKKLQQLLTCVETPWKPPANRTACRLINEIVLAEESDVTEDGRPSSHYELYLEAMQQCGADTQRVTSFVERFSGAEQEIAAADIPAASKPFLRTTLRTVHSQDSCRIAAAFTFGRENLLPDLFEHIVSEANQRTDGKFDAFVYYLDRHIELDGDEHGDMATRLVTDLCGNDDAKWQAATESAVESLEARLALWNGIADQLPVAARSQH